MKLYLIRHAESANNLVYSQNGSYAGRVPDPEITDTGHQQSQRLAQLVANDAAEGHQQPRTQISGFGFTHLYCSLMTRTILTAGYIAEARDLKLTALEDTFERGGIYERSTETGELNGLPGPSRQYFADRFPNLELPASLGNDGWYSRPYETEAMFITRMKTVVPKFVNQFVNTDASVALVAHGDFIDQFVNELMGVERAPSNYFSGWEANWVFNNTSITRIDFKTESPTIVYLNRVDHLPSKLMTW